MLRTTTPESKIQYFLSHPDDLLNLSGEDFNAICFIQNHEKNPLIILFFQHNKISFELKKAMLDKLFATAPWIDKIWDLIGANNNSILHEIAKSKELAKHAIYKMCNDVSAFQRWTAKNAEGYSALAVAVSESEKKSFLNLLQHKTPERYDQLVMPFLPVAKLALLNLYQAGFEFLYILLKTKNTKLLLDIFSVDLAFTAQHLLNVLQYPIQISPEIKAPFLSALINENPALVPQFFRILNADNDLDIAPLLRVCDNYMPMGYVSAKYSGHPLQRINYKDLVEIFINLSSTTIESLEEDDTVRLAGYLGGVTESLSHTNTHFADYILGLKHQQIKTPSILYHLGRFQSKRFVSPVRKKVQDCLIQFICTSDYNSKKPVYELPEVAEILELLYKTPTDLAQQKFVAIFTEKFNFFPKSSITSQLYTNLRACLHDIGTDAQTLADLHKNDPFYIRQLLLKGKFNDILSFMHNHPKDNLSAYFLNTDESNMTVFVLIKNPGNLLTLLSSFNKATRAELLRQSTLGNLQFSATTRLAFPGMFSTSESLNFYFDGLKQGDRNQNSSVQNFLKENNTFFSLGYLQGILPHLIEAKLHEKIEEMTKLILSFSVNERQFFPLVKTIFAALINLGHQESSEKVIDKELAKLIMNEEGHVSSDSLKSFLASFTKMISPLALALCQEELEEQAGERADEVSPFNANKAEGSASVRYS
jgi:hypothetical protein